MLESEAPRMALEGIKVVEAASMLAAPLAGMLLADHGADVVKIELPGRGDEMRSWGYQKDGFGLYWKVISRNKRLVALDLRADDGRAAFLRLLADADVLIVNFRPGTLERWGLSDEVLREAKPDLIVARVTGFGQTGPNAPRPGYGTLAEAMSGFAGINGWPDRPRPSPRSDSRTRSRGSRPRSASSPPCATVTPPAKARTSTSRSMRGS